MPKTGGVEKMFKATICCVLVALASASAARASVSSVAFQTPNLTQADASPTGNINTATTFSLQDLQSTSTSGVFAGLPTQDFGTVTFSRGLATSLTISDAAFGTFKSTSFTVEQNSAGFLNLLDEGEWTPGSFEKGVKNCASGCDSEVRINFTQTPPMKGVISFSGTLDITQPIQVVPEPPTALLFLSGIGLAAFAVSKLKHNLT